MHRNSPVGAHFCFYSGGDKYFSEMVFQNSVKTKRGGELFGFINKTYLDSGTLPEYPVISQDVGEI